MVSTSFDLHLDCVTHKAGVCQSSLRRMRPCCCLVSSLLVHWSTPESIIRRCVQEENTILIASALMTSVESAADTVVCGTVDPAGSPTVA